jgi:hypothetical protein
MDRLMDGTYGYDTLNATHHYMPDKMLLGTEVRYYVLLQQDKMAFFSLNKIQMAWWEKVTPHTILSKEKPEIFHAFHFLVWCGVIYFHIFTTPFEYSSWRRSPFYPALVIN